VLAKRILRRAKRLGKSLDGAAVLWYFAGEIPSSGGAAKGIKKG